MALVILNFKAYSEAIGENATKLAQVAAEVKAETGVRVIIVPQTADLLRVSSIIETMAQHTDPIAPGAGTGSNLVESLQAAGVIGSLLNHSERQIPEDAIKGGIERLRSLGLMAVVCAHNSEESSRFAALRPDFVAVEPPELIGSGVSVATAKPEVVIEAVEKVKVASLGVGVLCGAGISNGDDVKKATELGVEGVLLASAFTKAQDPKSVLQDICGGFR